MALSNRTLGEQNGEPVPVQIEDKGTSYAQPIVYHGVTATGRGRGYFVRVPQMPVLDTIAAAHGEAIAAMWHGFMVRALTQVGGSRGGAKGVAADRDSESAAIANAFAEVAAGTYESKGDDMDSAEADNRWNRTLLAAVKPRLVEALTAGNYPTDDAHVEAAFRQNYAALNEKYGEEAAKAGFEPSKKGAAKAGAPTLAITV